MIIINQDKTCVICGEVADLYMENTNAQTKIRASLRSDPDNPYVLAAYPTESQARKVLLDMAKHICDGGGQIYQMPPDQVPAPNAEKWISQLSAKLSGVDKICRDAVGDRP